MFQYIDTLREKPLKTRKKYAFGISFSVAFAIFLVWLATIPYRFQEKRVVVEREPSPLGSIVETVKGGIGDIKDAYAGASAALMSSSTNQTSTSTAASKTPLTYGEVIIEDTE